MSGVCQYPLPRNFSRKDLDLLLNDCSLVFAARTMWARTPDGPTAEEASYRQAGRLAPVFCPSLLLPRNTGSVRDNGSISYQNSETHHLRASCFLRRLGRASDSGLPSLASEPRRKRIIPVLNCLCCPPPQVILYSDNTVIMPFLSPVPRSTAEGQANTLMGSLCPSELLFLHRRLGRGGHSQRAQDHGCGKPSLPRLLKSDSVQMREG